MFFRLRPTWLTCFEGDGSGDGGSDGSKPQSFTQDDVNKLIAAERRKHQQKNDELAQQLRQLGEKTKMTDEEKDALKQRIEQLETEHLSVAEKARRESEKTKKQYDEQVTGLTGERDQWKRLHSDAVISNAIIGAATREATRAFDPKDVIALLQPHTATVPVEEEGKVVGYVPRVKWPDVDKDGKPVLLDYSVEEAVEHLAKSKGHLFVSTARGGTGASGSAGGAKGGKVDVAELARDPVKFREWRAKQLAKK